MARKRRSKHKHKTKTERNASETAQDGASISTDDEEFSIRLARVINYYAVNEDLIKFRRKVSSSHEREMTLSHKAFGRNRRTYVFGSQIEGTTTKGMMSDVDVLHRFNTFRLFLDAEHPPRQQHDHQVVIKVSTNGCASQYCVLTMIEPSTQVKHLQQLDQDRDCVDIVDVFRKGSSTTNGMIPHSVMFLIQYKPPVLHKLTTIHGPAERTTIHGPAESLLNTDTVNACYCKSLPKQCKYVFERPRPGHWPSEETLKKAKKYGVFIVPQGPPKSTNICTDDYFDYQWRISTNLTELLLMSSLDTVHLQTYVLTKMLRKELFMSEYRDRLSTFHLKTAFFFAVENTRPDVWREDNLMNCVKYIFATLRRFLTRRYCPHFSIENVNLFDGKIERHEFQKLVDKLTNVINSLRTKIENIQMDSIGKALNEHRTRKIERCRYSTIDSALFLYVFYICHCPMIAIDLIDGNSIKDRMIALFENECKLLEMYYRAPLDKYRQYDFTLHNYMSLLACCGASKYLEQKAEGSGYSQDGINKAKQLFIQSLDSNIIGNYMRYASFLFCNGEYYEACALFDLIEMLIAADKESNLIYQLCLSPSVSLAKQIANQSYVQSYRQKLSVFLTLRPAEAMCIPDFLRCDIYIGRSSLDTSCELQFSFYNNKYCMRVNIEPYLYYLQYLTYRELHQEPQKCEALRKLYKISKVTRSMSYSETSLNMLGHCLELEKELKSAWKAYKTSLQMQPERNSAVLHIIRLLLPVIQTKLC